MVIIALKRGKFFFPHRKKLKLFKENYSPDLLRKIIYAGAHSTTSFEEAEDNLKVIGEIYITNSHIQRLSTRIGREFVDEDNEAVAIWADKEGSDNQIDVASVSVDGGRAQIREENQRAGVFNPRWIETKVGCLQVLQSEETPVDPHPLLPTIFKDKQSIKNLVNGLKGKNKKNIPEEEEKENSELKGDLKLARQQPSKKEAPYGPKVVKKIVVACTDKSESFGNLVSYRARQQRLHTAKRKAYLGDGDLKIWTIYEDCFRLDGWIPILDFVHAVEYAFEGAKLSTKNDRQCWAKYIDFIIHLWQGRVLTVIRRLDKTIQKLNQIDTSTSTQEKIEKLTGIKKYFQNNYLKMNYPEYRKKGLPISSCHVESLIKQINIRVKSTEKFWNQSSLNGILRLKASLLSNDNSWPQFWNNRYDRQVNSKRHYKKTPA